MLSFLVGIIVAFERIADSFRIEHMWKTERAPMGTFLADPRHADRRAKTFLRRHGYVGRLVPRKVLGINAPTFEWSYDPDVGRRDMADHLREQLPPVPGRYWPGAIVIRHGETITRTIGSTLPEDCGLYLDRIEEDQKLRRLEIRSVFEPGLVVLSLEDAVFVRQSGPGMPFSWEEHYMGREQPGDVQASWEIQYIWG